MKLNLHINAPLLRMLEQRSPDRSELALRPEEVPHAYLSCGTHPDLVTRLWDELGQCLPTDCRFILRGTPCLVRPDTGVVFAFAIGTLGLAFRLPPKSAAAARAGGTASTWRFGVKNSQTLDLSALGPEWIIGGFRAEEPRWCREAFDHAATQEPSDSSGGA